MSIRTFFPRALASLLTLALIAPAAFFTAPPRSYAAIVGVGVPIIGLGPNEFTTSAETTISAIQNVLTQINTFTTAAATYAGYINTYVLQPLAFALSGKLMKLLTAGVIAFAIGKTNGTGIPQFIVDVKKTMQTVGDSQALAYLRQVGQTNSPFASSITSALRSDYLKKTSLAGFWAANMCTLSRTSPNIQSYLAGNWSRGGIATWFALTTQVQNDPYMLYLNSQNQMAAVVGSGPGGATDVRLADINRNAGFMSWCGPSSDPQTLGTEASNAQMTSTANKEKIATAALTECVNNGGSNEQCQNVYDTYINSPSASASNTSPAGINPGDACTTSDGTPGKIQTPGSTIKATLDKVLGGQQDQIVRMGNVGPQINQILGNIATVMQTVNFASQILGGSGSNNGLLSAGNTSSSNPTSRLAQFANTSNYLGVTNAQITAEASSSAVTASTNVDRNAATAQAANPLGAGGSGTVASSDMTTRVQQYQTAWGVISVAANAASSTVQSLITTCAGYGNPSQLVAAQTAIVGEIAPVLNRAAAVPAIAAAALAQDALVKSMSTTAATYNAEFQKLQSMSPTYTEVSTAQYDATSYGNATASPSGSLSVSGGSLTDQMNLIRTNAEALKTTVCTWQANAGGG